MAPKHLPRLAELAKPGVIAAVGSKCLRVALLTGCAQSVLAPRINDATVRLLTLLRAEVLIPNDTGCCGALTFHMGERRQSRKLMGHMIEVWHRETEGDGLDVIVLNTSGCATAVREYEYLFRHDPKITGKAKAAVERVREVRRWSPNWCWVRSESLRGCASPITMPVPTSWSAYKQ